MPTRVRFLMVILTVTALLIPASVHAQPPGPIDWGSVLGAETDPRISVTPNCTPGQFPADSGICIQFNNVSQGSNNSGQAALAFISYGDIAGDGGTEAVIPVHSGGPSNFIGYLVYRLGGNAPQLVTAQAGLDNAFITIDSGQLLVETPVFGSSDPACCPSHATFTTYSLSGNSLAQQSQRTVDITIRGTDWGSVIPSEPGVSMDPSYCPSAPPADSQITYVCISVAPTGSLPSTSSQAGEGTPTIQGFVVPAAGVRYGDIDGDGVEEAVVAVESGGQAGVIGFLVFHQASSQPQLVAAVATYQAGIAITNAGTSLVVITPTSTDNPPTGFQQTTWSLQGGVLQQTAVQALPPPPPPPGPQ